MTDYDAWLQRPLEDLEFGEAYIDFCELRGLDPQDADSQEEFARQEEEDVSSRWDTREEYEADRWEFRD
jgi:hypothetical protein